MMNAFRKLVHTIRSPIDSKLAREKTFHRNRLVPAYQADIVNLHVIQNQRSTCNNAIL
jgi:hypothetical protein